VKEKLSITFATIAGICFVSGLMILTHPIEGNSHILKTTTATK
jgi:hypothetical protein